MAGAGAAAQGPATTIPAQQPSRDIPTAQPRVVKTASLTLSVGKNASVTTAAEGANHIAEAHGGFVASAESFRGHDRQAKLTLRVPAASYDATLTALRRLGKVSNETLGGKDVTSALVDLDARLRSLRAQETALNALLAKANTVGETLQVAQAAGDVRTQIEQLSGQQQQLADQADFATIDLQILGPRGATDTSPESQAVLARSVERAAAGTLAVIGGTIVLLGYLLPVALVAAVAYGAWRLVGRRRSRVPAAVA
jgi:hypothetical protein